MRIDSLVMKIAQCGERITKLYEDLASGVLDREDYIALKTQYQSERNKYKAKMAEYQEELNSAQESMDMLDTIVETLKNRFIRVELNRELLEYMVEKIIVHEDRRIEIVFRFDDVFQKTGEIVEGGEE
jgi:chromosome segregation ATPase